MSPTIMESTPPVISQPRLIDRASRAVVGVTFVVIQKPFKRFEPRKASSFFCTVRNESLKFDCQRRHPLIGLEPAGEPHASSTLNKMAGFVIVTKCQGSVPSRGGFV